MKQKRAEKAGKWSVPIPKVKPVADDEMFKALASGKRNGESPLMWSVGRWIGLEGVLRGVVSKSKRRLASCSRPSLP